MRVVSIFEHSKNCLYAVMYEGNDQDALEILHEKWADPQDLHSFFKQYKRDYEAYYGKAPLSHIVEKTIDDADALFEKLFELGIREKPK